MKNIDGEIIVVDNNSNDDSYAFFQNKFPGITSFFIWNEVNVGFAKANNQALRLASGDYILFLNPDTLVPEDCFEKCISFIKSQKNNCALGIKMLDGGGNFLRESKRAFPSPVTSLYKLSGLARFFPHSTIFAKYHLGYLSENKNHEIDVLAGAFMMIPKKILAIVGGFDEDFFMYGEDIDLSFRIQKAGFRNFYFAESAIIHFKGESTKKGSFNYVRMFYKAMSIFVKKHYGSTRAGLFNFLIQAAIFLRAGIAAIARFLKWVGLPVIDAGIILMSFWGTKIFWSTFIKMEVKYSPGLLLIAFSLFTILFLLASYFAGLYDHIFKQSRLNKSALAAILVILSVYSLLPENLRFSRGILLFGSLLAFALMTVVRRLLLNWKIIESAPESNESNQVIIAGNLEEFGEVSGLIRKANKSETILGRIGADAPADSKAIGKFNDLEEILNLYPIKEIIFCEGELSFKKIIETIPRVPHHVRLKFFAKGSHTIIWSDDKNATGDFILKENFRLEEEACRRTKNVSDVIVSFLFILFFPFFLILKRRPLLFFKNVLDVLLRKKTWVGYATDEKDLPGLKPGIITTTGLPATLNSLPKESLLITDKLYAKQYHLMNDIKLVWKNYRWLS